jgi:hypothetical protein
MEKIKLSMYIQIVNMHLQQPMYTEPYTGKKASLPPRVKILKMPKKFEPS